MANDSRQRKLELKDASRHRRRPKRLSKEDWEKAQRRAKEEGFWPEQRQLIVRPW